MLNYILQELDIMKCLCDITVYDKITNRNCPLNILFIYLLRVYQHNSKVSILLQLKLSLKLEF